MYMDKSMALIMLHITMNQVHKNSYRDKST